MSSGDYSLKVTLTDLDNNYREMDYGNIDLKIDNNYELDVDDFDEDSYWGMEDDLDKQQYQGFATEDQDASTAGCYVKSP